MTKSTSLELNIERLVLHGVSPIHRRRVVEAVERELHRLFASGAEQGSARQHAAIDLGAQTFPMAAGLNPEQIGARVARAVWASSQQATAAMPSSSSDDAGDVPRPASANDMSGGESR